MVMNKKGEKGFPFTKMSGSGNDFILMDGMDGSLSWVDSTWVREVCQRALSVGADGLIILESNENHDFAWRFFNSDGSIGEMCGNGGRCAARFAYEKGIAGHSMTFTTLAGPIHAEVHGRRVKVQLTRPRLFNPALHIKVDGQDYTLFYIDTGVPHVVLKVSDIKNFPLVEVGRKIRFHEKFGPAGTNFNIVEAAGTDSLAVRTYERGVEGETLACGTGSVAAALMASMKMGMTTPVSIQASSGETLTVSWEGEEGDWDPVYLEGEVRFIYEGLLLPEAAP